MPEKDGRIRDRQNDNMIDCAGLISATFSRCLRSMVQIMVIKIMQNLLILSRDCVVYRVALTAHDDFWSDV